MPKIPEKPLCCVVAAAGCVCKAPLPAPSPNPEKGDAVVVVAAAAFDWNGEVIEEKLESVIIKININIYNTNDIICYSN